MAYQEGGALNHKMMPSNLCPGLKHSRNERTHTWNGQPLKQGQGMSRASLWKWGSIVVSAVDNLRGQMVKFCLPVRRQSDPGVDRNENPDCQPHRQIKDLSRAS